MEELSSPADVRVLGGIWVCEALRGGTARYGKREQASVQ